MSLIIPKYLTDSHLLAFNSFPDFADNTYAFYLYLEEKRYWERYEFVWLVSEVMEGLRNTIESKGVPLCPCQEEIDRGVMAKRMFCMNIIP